jgi:hypothetical protein
VLPQRLLLPCCFSPISDGKRKGFCWYFLILQMLPRIIVVFACLCAVLALPLPTADPCKHCLVFHPFQKDNIAYCQAQNLCPIHDDAVASDLLLKVDPPTVAFNDTLSTVGEFHFVFYSRFALGLRAS